MPAHLIAQEGPYKGLLLDLEEGEEWVVGRDPDRADFILEDSTVSRRHVRLKKTSEGIYLKNLSQINPTLINGEEHRESTLLKEGDVVQIGHNQFTYSEGPLPEGPEIRHPEKPKVQGAYDDIFGDAEMPKEPPPVSADWNTFTPSDETPPVPSQPEAMAYDTIFEQSEEELPFNLIFETPLILKVIAGPNAGAEIGIEKGKSYTIGKDPHSCEIVMQDMSVSRNHARLYINEDGTMEIEDLGSKNGTVVNGVAILERQVFTPQDLIALGTTLFMVADREAPQDTIYAPQIRNYEQAKETLETPSGEEIAANVEEELEQPKKHWKLEPIPFKHLVIAGSSMVMFLIVFLSFFSLFKPESLGPLPKEPVSHIQDALAKFKDVHYSFNPGTGRLFLVGHVSTPIEYQEMNYKLSQIDFITAVEDTVIIDEGVCRTMNDVITANSNWRGVSISSPEPGKFVAAGYLQTIAEANSLAEYLTVNFPYLDRLDNKVVVEQVLDAQLQGMLNAQSLGAVAYQLNNGEVVLTGRYSDKLKDKYQSFIKEIQATSGVVGVRDYAVATHEDMASVDVSQNYQVGGTALFDGEGYTVVLNGKIYALGEKVDGMKIASIHTDTILLEKDGLKYRINF